MTTDRAARMIGSMHLSSTLAWLRIDNGTASPDADRFLAELGARLVEDGLPLAGGALTIAAPRRTGIAAHLAVAVRHRRGDRSARIRGGGPPGAGPSSSPGDTGRAWLMGLGGGPPHEDAVGPRPDAPSLGLDPAADCHRCRASRYSEAARYAAAPMAALMARATLTATLEAYLGRRAAARVLAGPLRRGVSGRNGPGCARLRDLHGRRRLSEAAPRRR